jgi:hypothetical protein
MLPEDSRIFNRPLRFLLGLAEGSATIENGGNVTYVAKATAKVGRPGFQTHAVHGSMFSPVSHGMTML